MIIAGGFFDNAVWRDTAVNLLDFIPSDKHAAIAAGTNTDNLSSYFTSWCNHLRMTLQRGYIPEGVYHITQVNVVMRDVKIFGDGKDKSILRRPDNAEASGTIPRMIRFTMASGIVDIEGIGLDGNGANQLVPPPETPELYQQSHCIQFLPTATRAITSARIVDCHVEDATADGFGFSSTDADYTIGDLYVSGLTEGVRNYTRAALTLTCNYDHVEIYDSHVQSLDIEHDHYSEDYANRLTVDTLQTDYKFDIIYRGAGSYGRDNLPVVRVTNLIANGILNTNHGDYLFEDCTITLFKDYTPRNGVAVFRRVAFGVQDADTFENENFIRLYGAEKPDPWRLEFDDCTFAGEVSGYYIRSDNGQKQEGDGVFVTNCQFLGDVDVMYVQSGHFEIIDCEYQAGTTLFQRHGPLDDGWDNTEVIEGNVQVFES